MSLHEKKHWDTKANPLPPGGLGMRGEGIKNYGVMHAGIVRVIEAGRGGVPEAALLAVHRPSASM